MRLWGAALLVLGSFLLGMNAAGRLHRRSRELAELERAMELAAYMIERFQQPTPLMARELGQTAAGRGGALFADVARRLEQEGERPLYELWHEAVQSVDSAARPSLAAFGMVFGRYGAREQADAARRCRDELAREAERAEQRASVLARVYVALATAAGAAAAIVML